MTRVFVEHPDSWIGIPESFPNERWATATAWADELAEALGEDLAPPVDGQRKRLGGYLETIAVSRAERGASRVYVSIDDWAGPVYVADLNLLSKALVGDITLEQLAGVEDAEAVEKPIIESYTTESGLEGVFSVRYLNPPEIGGLLVRADYVWPLSDGFLQLYTAQFDLVAFERVLPRLEALARTVSVVD